MNIRLREGCRADIDGLSSLLIGLFSLETDFTIDAEKQRAGLALFLNGTKDKTIFVAEDNGVLVGMVTCQLVISTAVGGFSILLEDLYVSEVYRKKYIGTMLIQQVLSWGANIGALRIQLVADQRNEPAQVFYKKLGFQKSRMNSLYMLLS